MQGENWAKTRNLYGINEHFEPAFNAAAATQLVFQQPAGPFGTIAGKIVRAQTKLRQRLSTNSCDHTAPG